MCLVCPGKWVHEDSSAPEGFQDFPVLLASQVARVPWGLRATQVLLVSQDLLVRLAHQDLSAPLAHRACWGHQALRVLEANLVSLVWVVLMVFRDIRETQEELGPRDIRVPWVAGDALVSPVHAE